MTTSPPSTVAAATTTTIEPATTTTSAASTVVVASTTTTIPYADTVRATLSGVAPEIADCVVYLAVDEHEAGGEITEARLAELTAACRQLMAPTTTSSAAPPDTIAERPACHPNYTGCVPIDSDVDCLGGKGNGPSYTGPVEVIGDDVYDLDRDGDGFGCEDS